MLAIPVFDDDRKRVYFKENVSIRCLVIMFLIDQYKLNQMPLKNELYFVQNFKSQIFISLSCIIN